MEIILHKEVGRLGQPGDVVNVADGYARNYLIPRGMAEEATPAGLCSWGSRKQKLGKEQSEKMQVGTALAKKVNGYALVLKEKAGDEDQLFGSISAADIATALQGAGYEVDESRVLLAAPIKKIGEYEIELKLGEEPYPKIKLTVEKA